MKSERVNYNKISSNYDLRYKVNSLPGIGDALCNIISLHNSKIILEVGCGSARWLSEIGNNNHIKTGIDNSLGMLKKAKENDASLNLLCADANTLPFAPNHFEMIYCVNAFHHFRNKKEFILSAADHLRQNGILAIAGADPHNKNDNWYIYDFFEDVFERDLKRFPSFYQIANWMDEFGFAKIKNTTVECVVKEWIGNDVFNDTFLRKDQSSQLAILSDEEYSRGISKIRQAIENDPRTSFSAKLTFNCAVGIKQ